MNTKLLRVCATIAMIAFVGLLVTNVALASGVSVPDDPNNGPTDEMELIQNITNWILGITGAIAVVMIIYGGFRYITAGGNQQNMQTAKDILIKAIIGLVIVLVAYVIVTAILNAVAG